MNVPIALQNGGERGIDESNDSHFGQYLHTVSLRVKPQGFPSLFIINKKAHRACALWAKVAEREGLMNLTIPPSGSL